MLWAYTKLEAHLPVCQQAVSVGCSASYRDVHTSLLFPASLFIQHSWPPSLTCDSTMGGQPGLTTSHDPLFLNSSQSPQPATSSPSMQFCHLSFFSQPHLSSFHRKTAGKGGKVFLSAGMRGKFCLPGACMAHGMGLPPTSYLGWAPGSIPDESRQFLCPLGTVAACCSQRMKTY